MSKNIPLETAGKMFLDGQKIALAVHVSPDGDALGSGLGLAQLLAGQGKDVTVFVDDIIKGFSFLPGISTIKTNKDLDAVTEPLHFDVLGVLDCSTLDRIGRVAEKITADKVVNIDHHVSNLGFTEYIYVDAKAAATAELIVLLAQVMHWPLTKDVATNLFTALNTDSGSFKYSNVTPRTLRCAADLVEAGAEPAAINEAIDVTSGATMATLIKVLPTLAYAAEGRVAYICEKHEDYDVKVPTDFFVNFPRGIEGVQVGIFFKEVEPAKTRVSMRSSGPDVAGIASSFGGGGHHRAAGCTVELPLTAAVAAVLSAIEKVLQ